MTGQITSLLNSAQGGDQLARSSLFEMLQSELRGHARRLMGNERSDHTLQPSALINEACIKIIQEGVVDNAGNRRQLFHSAIRAMRQVLIDHAKARAAAKRGGDWKKQPLDSVIESIENSHQVNYLDLEEALQRLAEQSSRQHEALTLRFFGGMTIPEVAEVLECSVSTVEADWRLARAKLVAWLRQ
ncbi:MAG: ECF-type sigma factor [Aureliella sp.]